MAASREGAKWMMTAVVFFALAHASVKFLQHIPFYQLVFLRQFIAIIICLFMMARVRVNPWGKNKKMLVARGVMGTIALTSYFYSLHHMPLASAVTLQFLSPILTLVVSHFFFAEKAPKESWLAFVVAFMGVVMVKGFDSRITSFELLISGVSVVGSAFAYNTVRALKNSDHELVVVFYFPLVTLPIAAPIAFSTWVWPSGLADWLFVLMVGVCTFFAQLFMTKAYQKDTTADVGIYNYTGIVFALGIGYFFFNESFDWLSLLGMFVVLAAVFLGTRARPKAREAYQKR